MITGSFVIYSSTYTDKVTIIGNTFSEFVSLFLETAEKLALELDRHVSDYGQKWAQNLRGSITVKRNDDHEIGSDGNITDGLNFLRAVDGFLSSKYANIVNLLRQEGVRIESPKYGDIMWQEVAYAGSINEIMTAISKRAVVWGMIDSSASLIHQADKTSNSNFKLLMSARR